MSAHVVAYTVVYFSCGRRCIFLRTLSEFGIVSRSIRDSGKACIAKQCRQAGKADKHAYGLIDKRRPQPRKSRLSVR